MERRKYSRARLRLPARIRWLAPFGLREEVQQTEDVSRGGLKVPLSVPALAGTHLWVSFPYDSTLPESQPEMLLRATRCEPRKGGGAMLAGRFETLAARGAASDRRPALAERRASRRVRLSLPVRVRLENLPWFEETMTLDVSAEGLRFLSCREYERERTVFVSFQGTPPGAWNTGGEVRAVVARSDEVWGPGELAISVFRLGAGTLRMRRGSRANLARLG